MLHCPVTDREACGVISQAIADKTPLLLQGNGSKAGLGRPVQAEATLSSRAMSGITLYEPAEMVIAAKAGTSLKHIEAVLAQKRQMLSFEPMDYRAVLGSVGEPTIGAVALCNLSGPRRIAAGAARDSLLGVRFINGLAEFITSGGRVMKNVTGLDLVKLMAGSYGYLGFVTDVTFKVLPKPETSATLVFEGLHDQQGVEALCAAMGSPFEVSGAAHLPAGMGADHARTVMRLEGFAFSIAHRSKALQRHLKAYGAVTILEQEPSETLWREVRDAQFFVAHDNEDDALWRLSVAPSQGPHVVRTIAEQITARWFYDWSGGLIWLSCSSKADAGAKVIRDAVKVSGGHATLIRAPASFRVAVDVFQPVDDLQRRLMRDIKLAFDPSGLFNPGLMN
jgi:glycolate oxidase FAD binding subunit